MRMTHPTLPEGQSTTVSEEQFEQVWERQGWVRVAEDATITLLVPPAPVTVTVTASEALSAGLVDGRELRFGEENGLTLELEEQDVAQLRAYPHLFTFSDQPQAYQAGAEEPAADAVAEAEVVSGSGGSSRRRRSSASEGAAETAEV
jgi:hypothetical protein